MEIQTTFLIISTIFGLITPFIGIRAILKGEYKPQRTTRAVLFLVTTLFVASLYVQENSAALVLALVQWFLTLAILILSFKFGVGGTSRIDIVVFISALITIVIWKTTDNAVLALYMSIVTDLVGMAPTIYKSYKQPHTEDAKFYASGTVAGFFSLLALTSFALNEVAFAGYILLINLLLAVIIFTRKRIVKL